MDKAMNYLVDEEIITPDERAEIDQIVDFRNDAAHRFHLIVADISMPSAESFAKQFDYGAVDRLDFYRKGITRRMAEHCIERVGWDEVIFRRAEKAYKDELSRLYNRIDTLSKKRLERQFQSLIGEADYRAKE